MPSLGYGFDAVARGVMFSRSSGSDDNSGGLPGGPPVSALVSSLPTTLVRAVRVRTVLRCCCACLRSHSLRKEASAFNYQQSFETAHIADFLSHDWASSRLGKLLGLCLIYNSLAALAASLVMACGLAALQYGPEPLLPAPKPQYVYDGAWELHVERLRQYGYWCQVCCPLIFAIFFLFWQDLRTIMLLGSRSCFLDKFCIDQTNGDRKIAAINGLAGFLRCSDRFIVLWTPRYFTRLWCTYEVASWLHLEKPLRSVLLMPLAHAQIVVTLMSGFSCASVVLTVSMFLAPSPYLLFAVLSCSVIVAARKARQSTRHLTSLTEQLAEFSVTRSHCYCCTIEHKQSSGEEVPCDRELVYATVAKWFGGDNDRDAALGRFDEAVRTQFAAKVLAKAGPTSLSYRYAVVVGWPFFFRGCDVMAAADDFGPCYWKNVAIWCPTMALFAVPVFYKLAMHLALALDKHVSCTQSWIADQTLTLTLGGAYMLLMILIWYPMELLLSASSIWPMVLAAFGYTAAAMCLYHQDVRELVSRIQPRPERDMELCDVVKRSKRQSRASRAAERRNANHAAHQTMSSEAEDSARGGSQTPDLLGSFATADFREELGTSVAEVSQSLPVGGFRSDQYASVAEVAEDLCQSTGEVAARDLSAEAVADLCESAAEGETVKECTSIEQEVAQHLRASAAVVSEDLSASIDQELPVELCASWPEEEFPDYRGGAEEEVLVDLYADGEVTEDMFEEEVAEDLCSGVTEDLCASVAEGLAEDFGARVVEEETVQDFCADQFADLGNETEEDAADDFFVLVATRQGSECTVTSL